VNSSPRPHLPKESLDPVAAYDRLAPHYAQFSKRRGAYLRSVEEQIAAQIPAGASSLLDIGAGDGTRALRIASAVGIHRVVLLEPSARMSNGVSTGQRVWRVRAEDLDLLETPERFDAVTCLWNVLGHVQGFQKRARALRTAGQLLSPDGRLFVDVIHRYNVRSYGFVMSATRWLRDQLHPTDQNGDVVAGWRTRAGEISAYGHVFTDRDIRSLADRAGLERVERVVIDYETGELRKSASLGNLLYVFRHRSALDP
jgi:2-polyprenyl-3-methyl-5-hydroxy-6-metoxy-1,4-benzoquinol methylase